MNLELVAQFTEDAVAKEPSPCQRPSCRIIIQVGQPRHYIASRVPGQPGRHVCHGCYRHYSTQPGTLMR
jgi:hypothetical protein